MSVQWIGAGAGVYLVVAYTGAMVWLVWESVVRGAVSYRPIKMLAWPIWGGPWVIVRVFRLLVWMVWWAVRGACRAYRFVSP